MKKKQRNILNKSEIRCAYIFIAAPLLQFMIFGFGPVIYSLFASFTDWNVLSGINFSGLENYIDMFQDKYFWKATYNTVYLLMGVPITMALALLLAMGLNRDFKGNRLFRVIYYLPAVSSIVAISVLWKWIFNYDYGLLNNFLSSTFNVKINWLYDPNWIKPSLILISVWKGIGPMAIFYFAALKNIPQSYYEAAKIDGANRFDIFKRITLPMVTPISFYLLIMGVIGTFQSFAEVYVLANDGGNGYSAATLVFYLWENAFVDYEMGYASAVAWFVGILIFVVTFAQFKLSDKWVYEGK